jgi:hypothetical protein
MMSRTTFVLAVSAAALAITSLAPAEAGRRSRGYNGLEDGFVVAQSRFGNGSVEGAVREARYGLEVQTPGGNWIGCRASCSETLRVETVDFWENHGRTVGAGTALNECGVFGCLDIVVPLP